MRVLVDLARAGWIEPVRERGTAAARGEARGVGGVRRLLARAGPLAALVLVAALALLRAGGVGGAGVPIARDPLAEARAAAEALRLRRLVVAEDLARGAPPGSLSDVRGWPDGATRALAAGEVGNYHVARRHGAPAGDGLIVLAPER
jgi:hypothetical protein